jgi:FemAB-related protein (PEP-CTERM system-associated)
MKVVPIDSEPSEWDSFVNSHRDATAYHQFRWNDVISKSFGHTCHYLAAVDDQDEWQGVLPIVHLRSKLFGNVLVSVPFVNYGGILSRNEESAHLLLEQAELLRRSLGAARVELRHVARGVEGLLTKKHKVTMVMELAPNVERQWQAFDAKLRNQIRKAEKNGLTSGSGHLEFLDGFYQVFARNMRDLGTPVYSKDFFRNILQAFPETTRIFAVYYKEALIASGIALWFRETLEVPWASSIRDYKSLCPNNMLYWDMIRFAIGNNLRRLDFGRSTPNEGTYKFKEQWGAVPVPLYWQYLMERQNVLPDVSPANPKYHAAIRLWQRLPIPLTKFLGPLIVRNIP